jgi:hypothetical protein
VFGYADFGKYTAKLNVNSHLGKGKKHSQQLKGTVS